MLKQTVLRSCAATASVLLAAGGLTVMASTAAVAAPLEITVTNWTELEDAINDANANPGADTILIAATTITLEGDLPDITDPLTIAGASSVETVIDGDGQYETLAFGDHPDPGAAAEVSGLTVTGSTADGIVFDGENIATITLTDVVSADNDDGGVIVDGRDSTQVTIDDVVANNNTSVGLVVALRDGGELAATGVTAQGNDYGVVLDLSNSEAYFSGLRSIDNDELGIELYADHSQVNIQRSTIDSNGDSDYSDGGLMGHLAGTELTIDSSTVSNNVGPHSGVSLYMGGFDDTSDDVPDSNVLIVNSTLSGNTGQEGAVTAVDFNEGGQSSMRLLHSTVVQNTIVEGSELPGAIITLVGANGTIEHSVIADNEGPAVFKDDPAIGHDLDLNHTFVDLAGVDPSLATEITDQGTNIVSSSSPELGALADNGGTTLTHLPEEGSPVLDAGDPAVTGEPAFDQRGENRISNGIIDLGSVEVQVVKESNGGSDGGTTEDETVPAAEVETLSATGATVTPLLIGGGLLAVLGVIALIVAKRKREPKP